MEFTKVTIKADHSPESIASVVSILVVDENRGMGFVAARTIMLTGTVKQKLAQYKAATGKDWSGFDEQVISTPVKKDSEPVSLNLGKQHGVRIVSEFDREMQKKIDELSALAKRYIAENEIAKKLPREEQLQSMTNDEETSEIAS